MSNTDLPRQMTEHAGNSPSAHDKAQWDQRTYVTANSDGALHDRYTEMASKYSPKSVSCLQSFTSPRKCAGSPIGDSGVEEDRGSSVNSSANTINRSRTSLGGSSTGTLD